MPEFTASRSIRQKQHELLQLLYLFRFATASLIAEQQRTQHPRIISKRLKLLVDQGYIGMNYDSSYKLKGQPASYYLLPKSFKYIKTKTYVSPKVLKSIYYDKQATADQIAHYLNIFRTFNLLKQKHGKYYQIFAKSELRPWDSFPKDKPDLYMRHKTKQPGHIIDCFVDFIEDSTSYKRIKYKLTNYVNYAESDSWQQSYNRDLPTILVLCETRAVKTKAEAVVRLALDTSFVNLDFNFEVPAEPWTAQVQLQ